MVDTITVARHIVGTDNKDCLGYYNNEDDTSIVEDIHCINQVLRWAKLRKHSVKMVVASWL